jgi:hypothetical protein
MVLVNGVELPLSAVDMKLVDGLSVIRTKTAVRVFKAGVLDVTLDIARASFWENGPGQNFVSFPFPSLLDCTELCELCFLFVSSLFVLS